MNYEFVLPMLNESLLQEELESTNICCPVFSPQIVGGADPPSGEVTTMHQFLVFWLAAKSVKGYFNIAR